MIFRIYSTSRGGEPLWEEAQRVTAQDGAYSVLLGSAEPLTPELFATREERWLGIQVSLDVEMTPRFLIASVPYAVVADQAEHSARSTDADLLDGMDSTAFAPVAHPHQIQGGGDVLIFGGREVRVHAYVDNGVGSYTLEQVADPPIAGAGAFTDGDICFGSPFRRADAYDSDGNWLAGDERQTWFEDIPVAPVLDRIQDLKVITSADGEQGAVITALAEEGQLLRTVLDGDCDGRFPIPIFNSYDNEQLREGAGDLDHDGWPGLSGSGDSIWQDMETGLPYDFRRR